ncbi:MAG: hypothetical protein ACRDIZ_02360 [Actinomycetota bacterium]
MFVYYFVPLARAPFEVARRALLATVEDLPEAAAVAYRQGEEIRARLSGGGLAKTVRLELGTPLDSGGQVTIPLLWEATGTPSLFPRMEADLTLAAMGPDRCHLAFRGSYHPPLGQLGQALDRALLHRIAESSVKGFVDRLAEAIVEGMPPPAQVAGPNGGRRRDT